MKKLHKKFRTICITKYFFSVSNDKMFEFIERVDVNNCSTKIPI